MASVEEASEEGFVLVCCGNATGYRSVSKRASGHFFARAHTTNKNKRKCPYLGPFNTPKEAALALARTCGWGPEMTCDCPRCIEAAALPAPEPLTEKQVEEAAKGENLMIARSARGCGYTHIYSTGNKFYIHFTYLRSLPEAATKDLHNSFATAQEAALALARLLGPDGSAAHAAVEEPMGGP